MANLSNVASRKTSGSVFDFKNVTTNIATIYASRAQKFGILLVSLLKYFSVAKVSTTGRPKHSQELGGRFSRIVSCVFLFHGFFTDSSQMFHAHFNSPKSWWDCTASKNRAIRDRQVANDCQAHRHLLGITVAILRPGLSPCFYRKCEETSDVAMG